MNIKKVVKVSKHDSVVIDTEEGVYRITRTPRFLRSDEVTITIHAKGDNFHYAKGLSKRHLKFATVDRFGNIG